MNDLLTCTLITDGSSDKMLLQPIIWLLRNHLPDRQIDIRYADLSRMPKKAKLAFRLKSAYELFPCDLLFIHRDAEKMSYEERTQEISDAYIASGLTVPYIEVIPIRMTEAWMMHDEEAIRLAADNPNGRVNITLPDPKTLHRLSDPKADLEAALIKASELNKRRLKKFKPRQRMHRLSELIGDFTPLRAQTSFQNLEQNIIELRNKLLSED